MTALDWSLSINCFLLLIAIFGWILAVKNRTESHTPTLAIDSGPNPLPPFEEGDIYDRMVDGTIYYRVSNIGDIPATDVYISTTIVIRGTRIYSDMGEDDPGTISWIRFLREEEAGEARVLRLRDEINAYDGRNHRARGQKLFALRGAETTKTTLTVTFRVFYGNKINQYFKNTSQLRAIVIIDGYNSVRVAEYLPTRDDERKKICRSEYRKLVTLWNKRIEAELEAEDT